MLHRKNGLPSSRARVNPELRLEERFKCGICSSLLKNPVEGYCGHVFCKTCLKKLPGSQASRASASQVSCPVCKEKILARRGKGPKSREDVEIQMDALRNMVSAFTNFKASRVQTTDNNSGHSVEANPIPREKEKSVAGAIAPTLTRYLQETLNCSAHNSDEEKSKKSRKPCQDESASSLSVSSNEVVIVLSGDITQMSVSSGGNNLNVEAENNSRKLFPLSRTPQNMPNNDLNGSIDPGKKQPIRSSKEYMDRPVKEHEVSQPLDLSVRLADSQKCQVPRTPKIAFKVDPSLALDLSSRKKNRTSSESSNATDAPSSSSNILYPRKSRALVRNNASMSVSYSDPQQFNLDLNNSVTLRPRFDSDNALIEPIVANLSSNSKTATPVATTNVDDTTNLSSNPKSRSGDQLSSASKTSGSEQNTQDKVDNALLNMAAENFEQMTCRGDDLLSTYNLDLIDEQIKNPQSQLEEIAILGSSIQNSSGDKKRSVEDTHLNGDNSIHRANKKLKMTPKVPLRLPSPQKRTTPTKKTPNRTVTEGESREEGAKENDIEWMEKGDGNFSDSDGSEDLFFATPKSQRPESPKANNTPIEKTKTPQRSSPRSQSRDLRPKFNSSIATKGGAVSNNKESPCRVEFDPFDDEFDEIAFADCDNDNNTDLHHSNVGNENKFNNALFAHNSAKSPRHEKIKNDTTPVRNKTALVWGEDRVTPLKKSGQLRFGSGVGVHSPSGSASSPTTRISGRDFTLKSKQTADFVTPTKSTGAADTSALIGNSSQGKPISVFTSHVKKLTPSKPISPFKPYTPGKITPSKGSKNFVFCPTRLSKMQQLKLNQLCDMCGGKTSRVYNDDVTHLVLTLEDNRVPQTMKYLFAIAGKKWVVVFDWVEECLRQKKIVTEELFETSTFKGCDVGVMKSRLATAPLFKGFSFHVLGNLKSSGASIEDWRKLLRKLGAKIILDESGVTKDSLIVGDSCDDSEDYQAWFETRGVVTVAWEWILDCVLSYSLIQLIKDHYLITKCTTQQLALNGVPKELLP